MPRPKDPQTALAVARIMAGEPVRDVALAMNLDRSHLYRLLKNAGLKPPVCNKRGRASRLQALAQP